MVRMAFLSEIEEVQALYQSENKVFGFISKPMIKEAILHKELLVTISDNTIVGCCKFHKRKDYVTVIYEIVVRKDFRKDLEKN